MEVDKWHASHDKVYSTPKDGLPIRVYIRNVPVDMSHDELASLFAECNLLKVHIRKEGRPPFAFLHFANMKNLDETMALINCKYVRKNHQMNVEFARSAFLMCRKCGLHGHDTKECKGRSSQRSQRSQRTPKNQLSRHVQTNEREQHRDEKYYDAFSAEKNKSRDEVLQQNNEFHVSNNKKRRREYVDPNAQSNSLQANEHDLLALFQFVLNCKDTEHPLYQKAVARLGQELANEQREKEGQEQRTVQKAKKQQHPNNIQIQIQTEQPYRNPFLEYFCQHGHGVDQSLLAHPPF